MGSALFACPKAKGNTVVRHHQPEASRKVHICYLTLHTGFTGTVSLNMKTYIQDVRTGRRTASCHFPKVVRESIANCLVMSGESLMCSKFIFL